MKHYSGAALHRLVFPPSFEEAELVAALLARLKAAKDRHALARELGMSPFKLTGVLRGRWPIDDALAARLGYRRVTRFERIATGAPHPNPAPLAKSPERTS